MQTWTATTKSGIKFDLRIGATVDKAKFIWHDYQMNTKAYNEALAREAHEWANKEPNVVSVVPKIVLPVIRRANSGK